MRTPHLILGVDPGLRGALAFLSPTEQSLEIFDMPVLEVAGKRYVDLYALARIVDERSASTQVAFVEQVGVRPGEASTLCFAFGRAYEAARAVIAANFIGLRDVAPLRWKNAMGARGEKDEARAKASALFPRSAHNWNLKKHHGRAEAALIAAYGAQVMQREAA